MIFSSPHIVAQPTREDVWLLTLGWDSGMWHAGGSCVIFIGHCSAGERGGLALGRDPTRRVSSLVTVQQRRRHHHRRTKATAARDR